MSLRQRRGARLVKPEVLGEPIADAIGSAGVDGRSHLPQQVPFVETSLTAPSIRVPSVRFYPLVHRIIHSEPSPLETASPARRGGVQKAGTHLNEWDH